MVAGNTACIGEIEAERNTTFIVPGRGELPSSLAASSPSKLLANLPTAIEPCATEESKPALQASDFCEPSLCTSIHSSDGYIPTIIGKVSEFNWL
ncbi:hypothetical protein CEXT_707101 [Caerostris extrusa]|uniref:Uncharacterized protein n=1 Tax=Caerostris extrusa TaxID=172846 RepID=A0AAV4TYT9_CAEEX|nr:hypothetical protein CEXT_707101 [Caerostris extrusa]